MKNRLPMTLITRLTIAALAIATTGIGCEKKVDTTTPRTDGTTTSPAPDNTARNKVDAGGNTKTPMDQSESSADIKITAQIRRDVMDDKSLSTTAKNCKIITDKAGVVTLRGPVNSQAEKDSIEAKAKAVAGVTKVDNQLEIKPPG